jgi:hypothetical protein
MRSRQERVWERKGKERGGGCSAGLLRRPAHLKPTWGGGGDLRERSGKEEEEEEEEEEELQRQQQIPDIIM